MAIDSLPNIMLDPNTPISGQEQTFPYVMTNNSNMLRSRGDKKYQGQFRSKQGIVNLMAVDRLPKIPIRLSRINNIASFYEMAI